MEKNNLQGQRFSSKEENYLKSLPLGYRFCPTDTELLVDYLRKKVLNKPLPPNRIREVNLYNYDPQQLWEMCKTQGESIMYIFTPRDRKYRNGNRPNRAAANGYWKATGADAIIGNKNAPIGYRKALVFYEGNFKDSIKTKWIMHEYRVDVQKSAASTSRAPNDMKLDDWVLCKVYKKGNKTEEKESNSPPLPYHIDINSNSILPNFTLPNSNYTIDNNQVSHLRFNADHLQNSQPLSKPQFAGQDSSPLPYHRNINGNFVVSNFTLPNSNYTADNNQVSHSAFNVDHLQNSQPLPKPQFAGQDSSPLPYHRNINSNFFVSNCTLQNCNYAIDNNKVSPSGFNVDHLQNSQSLPKPQFAGQDFPPLSYYTDINSNSVISNSTLQNNNYAADGSQVSHSGFFVDQSQSQPLDMYDEQQMLLPPAVDLKMIGDVGQSNFSMDITNGGVPELSDYYFSFEDFEEKNTTSDLLDNSMPFDFVPAGWISPSQFL